MYLRFFSFFGMLCHSAANRRKNRLLDLVLEYDLTDILINRNECGGFQIGGTGTHSGTPIGTAIPKRSSSRKYMCPCCGMSIRATREVNIGCLDCAVKMVPAA